MESKVTFSNLLLKDQVLTVYSWLGVVKEHIPGKGSALLLDDPKQRLHVRVTLADHRSVYGKRLYLCEHRNY